MPHFMKRSTHSGCALLLTLLSSWSVAQTAVVLNSRDATISLIDMRLGKETARIDTGKEPHHLYPTPDGKALIVANAVSNDLLLLDPRSGTVQRRIRAIDDPYQIGFSPDQKRFVAAALRLNRVDIYDFDGTQLKIAKRIPLRSMPSHLAFNHASSMVYVTLQGTDSIVAIDLHTLTPVWDLVVGPTPAGIHITPDDRHLLVGITGADYATVVDIASRKVAKRITTAMGAHNFRALGDRRHVYISNRVANSVTLIDMQTLEALHTIPVPGGPDCMEITADGRQLWVTSRFARQVSEVDLQQRRVVQQIPVGRSPHGIFFADRAPLI
jgi:YVTN family beta-propeller protein